jgi:hypothetical protein
MGKSILTSILLLSSILLQAQTVVIEETVEKPNQKISKPSNIQFGAIWDITFYGGADQKGIAGTLANSVGINFLINAKHKLNKHFLTIGYLGFNTENYGFKKTSDNNSSFPNNDTNNLEKYSLGAISGGLGFRFTTNKKVFLEIGAFAKYNHTRDLYMEKNDKNGNVNEVTIKDLNYINQFNYDAYARLGYKAISIVAYYRMNDMFSVSNIAPVVYEMPRLRLGISLGM